MNENQAKPDNLVDTTDCLEAVNVFKGCKNALFIIAIVCLLLLQASFWVVDTGYVKAENKTEKTETTIPVIRLPKEMPPPPKITPPLKITPPPAKDLVVPLAESDPKESAEKVNKIKEAAKKAVVAEPNQPAEAAPQQQKSSLFEMTFERLASLIRFFNFLLILAAILYCLTMLFSLKVSLLGRFGGINHISRAFFFSLAFAVLLLPWQRFFPGVFLGAMYTSGELKDAVDGLRAAAETTGIFDTTLHYLRFTGYWLLVLLLLIFSQLSSSRWSKAILRRLEVI